MRQLSRGLCTCAIQRVNGNTNDLRAFDQGRVVGARHNGLNVSRTATLLGLLLGFHAHPFIVCIKNGPPPKGHAANWKQLREALESTCTSIPVEGFRHLVESTLRRN